MGEFYHESINYESKYFLHIINEKPIVNLHGDLTASFMLTQTHDI